MSNAHRSLQQDVAEVEWKLLRSHVQRDSVILVDSALNLVEVAVCVKDDDGKQVGQWIEEGLLRKPDDRQLRMWERQLDRMFRMLIVRPFILAQETESADGCD